MKINLNSLIVNKWQFLVNMEENSRFKLCKCSADDSYDMMSVSIYQVVDKAKGMHNLECIIWVLFHFHQYFSRSRAPETLTKKIIWQTLQAVNFCHRHNVRTLIVDQISLIIIVWHDMILYIPKPLSISIFSKDLHKCYEP